MTAADERTQWRWWHSIGFAMLVRLCVAMFGTMLMAVIWLSFDPRGKQLLAQPLSREMWAAMGALAVVVYAEAVINMRRRLVRMRAVLAAMEQLSDGEVDVHLNDRGRDEIARAALSVSRGADGMRALLVRVSEHAHELRTAADALAGHAATVTRHTAETAQHAILLSGSIDEVNATLDQLLVRAGDVTGSIDAIAQRTAAAGQAATRGVTAAAATEDSVSRLETSSSEISGVVAFINTVAAQTNLLALNATIEAARAGEAGKGFAVVAGEVKGLAQQTEQATGSIDAQVGAIRQDAAATVEALQGIAGAIEQINAEQAHIGAAVESQRASTTEMTRRVNDTASTTLTLTTTIAELAEAATRSTAGTREVADAVRALAAIAAGLDQLTDRYNTACRQAAPDGAAVRAPEQPATAPEPARQSADAEASLIELF
jgi:methyl-accepting chemotaxis protein